MGQDRAVCCELGGLKVGWVDQAGETTDETIESWLKRSIVGKASGKFTPQMEVDSYNALYSLPLEVTLTGSGSSGLHSIQSAQLTVRYYPLGLNEPGFCIPDAKGKVETYAPL
ncbi:MAG: hypothetical protein C4K60_03420 [Ideonella sp. MAG2]|nr:MAG: hypothetical protein C4K60_03420 [Ideonella sp. MAG2]